MIKQRFKINWVLNDELAIGLPPFKTKHLNLNMEMPDMEYIEDLCRNILHLFSASQLPYNAKSKTISKGMLGASI